MIRARFANHDASHRAASGAQARGLVTFAILSAFPAALWWHAVGQDMRPQALGADADPRLFSAERALAHIRRIARAPRPAGTPEHARARTYLIQELARVGAAPAVQRRVAAAERIPGLVSAARVANVVARIRGKSSTRAVLLVAHYDSVPAGPGASDDGIGVGAALEIARVLSLGPAPAYDVWLLLSDAEENGLLGAAAFTREVARLRIDFAVNMDSRGNDGPAHLFEAAGGVSLVSALAERLPSPAAESFAASVYALLPNDTDFSVLREAGIRGVNFAPIRGLASYHTALDTADRISPRTLQHLGDNALAAVRFGAAGSPPSAAQVGGWTVLPVIGLSTYSLAQLVVLLGGFAAAWMIVADHIGITLRAALRVCIAAVFAGAVCFLGIALVGWLQPYQAPLIPVQSPESQWKAALCIVCAIAGAALAMRTATLRENLLGSALVLTLLGMLCAVFLPGAAYVFLVPGALMIAPSLLAAGPRSELGMRIIPWAAFSCAVPSILFLGPLFRAAFDGLSPGMTPLVSAALVMYAPHLLPPSALLGGARRFVLAALGAAYLAAIAWGVWSPLQTARFQSAFLAGGEAGAFFHTCESRTDGWLAAFGEWSAAGPPLPSPSLCPLSGRPFLRANKRYPSPPQPELRISHAKADSSVVAVRAPEGSDAVFVQVRRDPGIRSITLRGVSPGTAPKRIGYEIIARRLEAHRWWTLAFANPGRENILIEIRAARGTQVVANAASQRYGFAHVPPRWVPRRPRGSYPAPSGPFTDSVFGTRRIKFIAQ